MGDSRAARPDSERQEALRIAYGEVCRAHDGIAEFRAKLLALLPIASGAGIFLLLDLKEPHFEHLIAVGIFGGLIAVGLYVYELRGIQKCNALIGCGRALEKEILVDPKGKGTFTDDPKVTFGFVGATIAARIVYPSVIGGWAYVSLTGFRSLNPWLSLGISVVIGLAFVCFGRYVGIRERQDRIAKRRKEHLKDRS